MFFWNMVGGKAAGEPRQPPSLRISKRREGQELHGTLKSGETEKSGREYFSGKGAKRVLSKQTFFCTAMFLGFLQRKKKIRRESDSLDARTRPAWRNFKKHHQGLDRKPSRRSDRGRDEITTKVRAGHKKKAEGSKKRPGAGKRSLQDAPDGATSSSENRGDARTGGRGA